jgi:hypothetical protein
VHRTIAAMYSGLSASASSFLVTRASIRELDRITALRSIERGCGEQGVKISGNIGGTSPRKWCDRVDSDVILGTFTGQTVRQANKRHFGAGVVGLMRRHTEAHHQAQPVAAGAESNRVSGRYLSIRPIKPSC